MISNSFVCDKAKHDRCYIPKLVQQHRVGGGEGESEMVIWQYQSI